MDEERVQFNEAHHCGGLNAKFLVDASELKQKFAGPAGIFEGENRDIAMRAPEILAEVVKRVTGSKDAESALRGATVLDIGAGTGVLEPHLCRLVGPEGSVWATDLSPGFVQLIRARDDYPFGDVVHAAMSGVRHVIAADSEVSANVLIERNEVSSCPYLRSVDVALMCDVYHHLEYPRTFLRDVARYMKPQCGRLVVVDFYRQPERMKSHPPSWALEHLRADKEVFVQEMNEAGWVVESDFDLPELTPENYFLILRLA